MSEQALRLLRNMILTRLLAPEHFGLMALVLSVTSLVQVLTGVGVKEATVQNPQGGERTFLNSAWWVSVGRAFLLYAAVFACAPYVAAFYGEPALRALLRVAFASVLLQGALSPGTYLALKQMRYGRWVLVQHLGGALGIGITLLLALKLRGVWALALGHVAEAGARCVLSYLLCPPYPGLRFNRAHLASLVTYARGIFGLPVLTLIYSEASVFMAGRLCSKRELGLFALTLGLARIPTMLGGLLVDLLMPTYSQLQHDLPRLNRALLRVTSLMVFAGLPCLALVWLLGGALLELVYGAAYREAAAAFALLTANEILMTCNIPLASVYLAVGQPGLLRRFALIRAGALLALIYPAIKTFGITGAAASPLAAMALAYGFQLAGTRRLTGLSLGAYGGVILRGLVFPLPLLAAWAAGRTLVAAGGPAWRSLALTGGIAAMLYAAAACWLWRAEAPRKRLLESLARRPSA
jgi:O-antigen/teichoic acid export membrane protein